MEKPQVATERDLAELEDSLFQISLNDSGGMTVLWNSDIIRYLRTEIPAQEFLSITEKMDESFQQFMTMLKGGLQ